MNIRVLFWVNIFKNTRSVNHLNVRSQVSSNVVAVLIENGFSLPANIVELKNYKATVPLQGKSNKSN